MIELPSLYAHQEDIRDRTRLALQGHRRVILTAPPGVGKTRIAKWILASSANREPNDDQSGRSLFAVHRRGLVDNASNSFADEPCLPHGVIMSGVKPAYGARTQVGSIDTLNSWFIGEEYKASITFDLIIYDECVSGDSVVETELGAMRIDAIPSRKPNLVKSYSPEKGAHYARILNWTAKGSHDTLEVHTHAGKIRCTPDHEIYTRRGWLQAQFVSHTDDILVCSACGTSWSRVTKIARASRVDVFDIEVAGSHCFFANGLLVHNCHAHLAKLQKFLARHDAYRKELKLHPAYVIGLSATPQCRGLADTYREIIEGPPTQWLIDNGFLAPFRYFRATQGRLELLVKRGGEFTEQSASDAMEGLSGDLVRDWKQFAEGRPTVGFFPRRSHAQEAMGMLRDAGLKVAYIDGETEDLERRRIFWEMNHYQLNYLCNVQVVERGTDIPALSCAQMCVAVGSFVRWRQMIGRISRVDDGRRSDGPDVPPKSDVIVIDHGGNLRRDRFLGLFEDDPIWSLDRSQNKAGETGVRPTIECPNCCVARGTMILTDRGEVPIQDVRINDRVWDGVEFCSHNGTCCNGIKEVINWGELILTPDHKVLTNDGWKEAEAAKSGDWRPVVGGIGGTPIRTIDDSNPYYPHERENGRSGSRLLALRKEGMATVSQNISKAAPWMRALSCEIWPGLPGMACAEGQSAAIALPVSSAPCLQELWRTRDRVSISFGTRRRAMDYGQYWLAAEPILDDRPHRQQRALRTGESSLGNDVNAVAQSKPGMDDSVSPRLPLCDVLHNTTVKSSETRTNAEADRGSLAIEVRDIRVGRNASGKGQAQAGIPFCEIQQTPYSQADSGWNDTGTDRRPMAVEVWDIRNVGPRNRYCANGVIVSNCAIYRGGKCRQCGYEPTKQQRKAQGLEFDGSELVEITKRDRKQKAAVSAEQLMLKSLYASGKSGRTWKQAVGMFFGMNSQQGTSHKIPKRISVGGHTYRMLPYDSNDSGQRVAHLFPFTVERGNHSGDYLEG